LSHSFFLYQPKRFKGRTESFPKAFLFRSYHFWYQPKVQGEIGELPQNLLFRPSHFWCQPKGFKGAIGKPPYFFAHSGTGTGVTSGPGVSSFGLSFTGAGVVGTGVGSGRTGGVTTTGSSASLSST